MTSQFWKTFFPDDLLKDVTLFDDIGVFVLSHYALSQMYTIRQFCDITLRVCLFCPQHVEIYVSFNIIPLTTYKRPLTTLWHGFIVAHQIDVSQAALILNVFVCSTAPNAMCRICVDHIRFCIVDVSKAALLMQSGCHVSQYSTYNSCHRNNTSTSIFSEMINSIRIIFCEMN